MVAYVRTQREASFATAQTLATQEMNAKLMLMSVNLNHVNTALVKTLWDLSNVPACLATRETSAKKTLMNALRTPANTVAHVTTQREATVATALTLATRGNTVKVIHQITFWHFSGIFLNNISK